MGFRRNAWTAAAALLLTITCAPAFAQTEEDVDDVEFDRDCMDDYGRNLCDVSRWGGIVATFGIDTADAAWAKGWRGVRVFTVDGYSSDMPMIAVRDGGALEVRGADEDPTDDLAPAILTGQATPAITTAVAALKTRVAAAPVRQSAEEGDAADKDSDVISICLHAWVTVTESITQDGVTRRVRNACGDNPLFDAAFDMSKLALDSFDHCKQLHPKRYRNDSARLMGCLSLKGEDLMAAAEVANLFNNGEVDKLSDFAPLLTADARIALPGVAPASARDALTAAPFDDFDFYAWSFVGEPEQVTISGGLFRSFENTYESADLQQVWRKQDYIWKLTDLTVGPITREQ